MLRWEEGVREYLWVQMQAVIAEEQSRACTAANLPGDKHELRKLSEEMLAAIRLAQPGEHKTAGGRLLRLEDSDEVIEAKIAAHRRALEMGTVRR